MSRRKPRHTQLARVCRDGDTRRAGQLIYQYAELVKTLVREVITDAGGQP